jgi:Protein of unknown function (DUF2815)
MPSVAFSTPIGIISHPHLWRPKSIEAGKPPKYSCAFILTPEKVQAVRDAILSCAKMEWGEESLELLRTQRLSSPLRSGDEPGKADDPAYKGRWFFNAYRDAEQGPPIVTKYVGPGQPLAKLNDQTEMFAGCFVQLELGLFTYKTTAKRGVGCALNGVTLIAPGPRLDNRGNTEARMAKNIATDEAEQLRAQAQAQAEQGSGANGGASSGASSGPAGSPW